MRRRRSLRRGGEKEEEQEKPSITYRGGSNTDNNYTPRLKDTDGLSTFTDPAAAAGKNGGRVQILDLKKLEKEGFKLDWSKRDGYWHVGIAAPDPATHQEWANTKETVKNGGAPHILTEKVKLARLGQANVPANTKTDGP